MQKYITLELQSIWQYTEIYWFNQVSEISPVFFS